MNDLAQKLATMSDNQDYVYEVDEEHVDVVQKEMTRTVVENIAPAKVTQCFVCNNICKQDGVNTFCVDSTSLCRSSSSCKFMLFRTYTHSDILLFLRTRSQKPSCVQSDSLRISIFPPQIRPGHNTEKLGKSEEY